jgi:hypothetical protein
MQMSRTQIIAHDALPAALLRAHGHTFSALATDEKSLQECGPFSWRRKALGRKPGTLQSKLGLISLVVLPTKVPHMGILHKSEPICARQLGNMHFAIGSRAGARASIARGSCIGRVMQHAQDLMMLKLCPPNLTQMRTAPNPPGKEETGLSKVANWCARRARMLKAVKDFLNASLYLPMGVKHNPLAFGVTPSHGQGKFEGSTPGCVEKTPEASGRAAQKAQPHSGCPSSRATADP